MKYFLIFLILIGFAVAAPEAFGKCISDPSFPNAPCNDEIIIEIMPHPKTHIENIGGELFLISESFSKEPESEKIVRIKDVSFMPPSYPVPTPPGGVVFTKITFSDGVKESLSRVGPPEPFTVFTKHKNPQAGFRGNLDGTFSFLVSIEKQDVSPLKQFESGIPIDKIQCKEGLELILKSHDGSPACVKPETKQKLIQRGWAVNDLPTKTESEGIQTAFETWTTQGMVLVNIDKLTNTVDSVRLVDSTPDINATQVEENQKKIIQAALSNIQVQKLTKEKDYFIFQVRHNHVYCDNCMCPEEGCTLVGFSTTENQKFGVGMTVILNPTTGQVFDIRTSQAWNQTQNEN